MEGGGIIQGWGAGCFWLLGAGAAWKKSQENNILPNLTNSGEKNILPNLTNSQDLEPGVFGPLEPEPLKKYSRSRSRLGKKSGAGAA